MLSFENSLLEGRRVTRPAKEVAQPAGFGLSAKIRNDVNYSRRNHSVKETLHLCMLTTYPPRECGIATFSQDLLQSINQVFASNIEVTIAAIDKKNENRQYPSEVGHVFKADDGDSYKNFAVFINSNRKINALVVQHEFGLFPGDHHRNFNVMLDEINKPVLLVMHTVLPSPEFSMQQKVSGMLKAVTRVVVMTNNSARLLADHYGVPAEKIVVIPHGTHLQGHLQKDQLKEKYGLKGRMVLSTFGLIGPNKNIETTLKALPQIIHKYPDVIFLVLGRTHPGVIMEKGEDYRRELEQLVSKNNLENHVRFVNRYLSLNELLEYLGATDVYLFTSKDPGQAVSGTFSYALSAGCAIVATPIPHAKELHDMGNGLLFEFENPQSLAAQILTYLNDPQLREELGRRAMETMAGTAWGNIANRYIDLLNTLDGKKILPEYRLQPVNTRHLEKLTTDIGLLQFARYNHPDPASGYTLDDNARALITATALYKQNRSAQVLPLCEKYLQFIIDCQLADGSFINYRNEDGSVSKENNLENLEDSNGRAIWALGYFSKAGKELRLPFAERASLSLIRALPMLEKMHSPRAVAFSLKGLSFYHSLNAAAPDRLFEKLANHLVALYKQSSDEEWKWFETYLTYANAVLPEAMLIAWQITQNPVYKEIAINSFDFFLSKIFKDNRIKVISNKGWLQKDGNCHGYGEQPIDVTYTILALDTFYSVLGNDAYARKLKSAFNWFYGENHLKSFIYNSSTGGCFDGLEETGVNLNQGAESTICYLLARMTAGKYYDLDEAAETKTLFS